MDQEIQKAVTDHAKNDMRNLPPERAQPIEAARPNGPKIGDGHFSAMLRLGGKELTNALAAFPDSNIRPQEEMGVYGSATPQMVTEEIRGQDFGHNDNLIAAAQRGPAPDQDRGRSR